jgi:hypothetical protein
MRPCAADPGSDLSCQSCLFLTLCVWGGCVCVRARVCVRFLSPSEIRTTRTSRPLKHQECPAVKPPPTFCLLLRALDRGRPPDDGSGAVKQLGVADGAFWTAPGALFDFEVDVSTFQLVAVVSMLRRDTLGALGDKRRSCGGVKGER